MDENMMRVLEMLQEGKISAQEAEMLLAALRGETSAAEKGDKAEAESKEEKPRFGGIDFEKLRPPKIDFDSLGERISQAVSRVQPEKIVRRVQAQLRTASRASAHWSNTVSARVRHWADGGEDRPKNSTGLPEYSETHEQEFHLDAGAKVFVENPLGNVKIVGVDNGPASVTVSKTAWSLRADEAKTTSSRMEINMHGTDARLDIKVSAADLFRDGVVDLELKVPRALSNVRVNTRYGDIEISQVEGLVEGLTTSGVLHLHDLSGDARGETAGGAVTLERIAGAATVASQSGDITAAQIRRGLIANTASGDVRAQEVEGGRVECKSVSGDASVERVGLQSPVEVIVESISGHVTLKEANGGIGLKAVSGSIEGEALVPTRLQAQTVSGDVALRLNEPFSSTMQINTVSGDVTVVLPEGSNVRVSLSTSSGELRCAHAAHDVAATETLWNGQIGTGAGTLNVQTISGHCHIEAPSAGETKEETPQ